MVYIIRRASSQDRDALQDGQDQFSVEALLQERVQLILLDEFFKLLEILFLISTASYCVPDIFKFLSE